MNDSNKYVQAIMSRKLKERFIVNQENKVYNLRNQLEDNIKLLERRKQELRLDIHLIEEYESDPNNSMFCEDLKDYQ